MRDLQPLLPGMPSRAGWSPRSIRIAWVAGYGTAAVLPLAVIAATTPNEHRGFVVELASALGIVAFSLLVLQLVVPARLGVLVRALGADVAIRVHRHIVDVLAAAIVAHVALVMVDDPANVALLDPLGAPWRAQAAIGSCAALTALVASSLLRRRLRLSYARWRGAHLVLGLITLALAVAHGLGIQRHQPSGAAGPVMLGLAALAVGAVIELRVLRPRRLGRRPYRVEHVVAERGGATTLVLRAEGHGGHAFRPGQFAWLKTASGARRLTEHPFSYASSAIRPDEPAFTIKAYGGFTRTVAGVAPGTRVLIDGPHGAFRGRDGASRLVLIAGGIGITPVMSLLRTAADVGDRRPHLLLYGSLRWEDVTFREELDRLGGRLALETVHVLTRPAADWRGETGFIDAPLLGRRLGGDPHDADVFLAGPPAMVAAVLRALDAVGAPPDHVHAEQFVLV